jgi:hypothetical protein
VIISYDAVYGPIENPSAKWNKEFVSPRSLLGLLLVLAIGLGALGR